VIAAAWTVVSAMSWSVLKAAQSSVVKSRMVVVVRPGMRATGMNGTTVAMAASPAVVLKAADWFSQRPFVE
jgi:hypothetical protein